MFSAVVPTSEACVLFTSKLVRFSGFVSELLVFTKRAM